jgi:hypothetical protein
MDAVDLHEVLRGPSVGIVIILVRHPVNFCMALVPQLYITAPSLAGVRTVRGRPALTSAADVTYALSRRCYSNLQNTLAAKAKV